MKKSWHRLTPTQATSENASMENQPNMFDIAHSNALDMINIEEDRIFIIAQQEPGRRGVLAGVDRKLAEKLERRQSLDTARQERYQKHERETLDASQTVKLTSDSEDESERPHYSTSSASAKRPATDDDYVVPLPHTSTESPPLKCARQAIQSVIDSEVTAALDRAEVTDREAAFILSATAKSLGQDPTDLTLSGESIRKKRMLHRETTAGNIKAAFRPDDQTRRQRGSRADSVCPGRSA